MRVSWLAPFPCFCFIISISWNRRLSPQVTVLGTQEYGWVFLIVSFVPLKTPWYRDPALRNKIASPLGCYWSACWPLWGWEISGLSGWGSPALGSVDWRTESRWDFSCHSLTQLDTLGDAQPAHPYPLILILLNWNSGSVTHFWPCLGLI